MIIDLRTISGPPRTIRFILDKNWWKPETPADPVQGLEEPVLVSANLYKAGDKFVLEGRIGGRLRVVCDRCTEAFPLVLDVPFQVVLAVPDAGTDEEEVELDEEDLAVDFIIGNEIDLAEVVREQIYLALPMKLLCREDCRGICPGCGCNLNRGECRCGGAGVNPAFAKLKSMKIQGD